MSEILTPDQIFIRKLTDIVLENLDNKDFGVNELAGNSGISRTSLNRKLRRILNKSINQFIREVRLQKAREILCNEEVTSAEVAYTVGFSSPAYFNTCFHEYFGYPPGKAKQMQQFNLEEKMLTGIAFQQGQKEPWWQKYYMKLSAGTFILGILVFAAYYFYPGFFNRQSLDDIRSSDGRISVAVMPFKNMTNDKIWDGFQSNLVSYLSNNEELILREKEYINLLLESEGLTKYASITPSAAGAVSKKLNANVFINGVINQTDNVTRINAQLINTKSKQVFRSFQLDVNPGNNEIFKIIDSLSVLISNFLVKSKMEKEVSPDLKPYKHTNSPLAFRYLVEADDALKRYDVHGALNLYLRAVAADSNYIPAIVFLSMRYINLDNYEDAKKWCLKAYNKKDRANRGERIMIDWYHATLFSTPDEEIKFMKQFQAVDDMIPVSYWQTGNSYLKLFQYDKAIPEFKRALDIYKKWGVKPMMADNYTHLGFAYHQSGLYKKEKSLYRKAMNDFPGDHSLLMRYAILELSLGDSADASSYIEKYTAALKDLSTNEAEIMSKLALLYSEASVFDKAEKYYRKALSLDPGNAEMINNLAYFLIDKGINLNEGIGLAEAALKSEPDNYSLLHTLGWGWYKQGKFREALEVLQKSWILKPIYRHEIYLHLEEVKKVFSDQN
jgi:AraC-like DNA-binding protein/tetratricopeptide (TPR) repeat protein